MITMYRVFLVLMTGIAAFMIPEALALPSDSKYTIGPGFLPTIMLGLVIVTCLLLVMDLRNKVDYVIEKDAGIRLVLYILATVLLILGMEHIGIIVSVIVYIFCVLFFVEKIKLFPSAKVSVLTGVIIYLLFHTWLQVPMTICNFF